MSWPHQYQEGPLLGFRQRLLLRNFGVPVTNPVAKNFGKLTGQSGVGRIVQLNLRIEF